MAKGLGPLLILGGAAALAMVAKKKKADSGTARPSDQPDVVIDPNEVPAIGSNQVGFSANFENFKIGNGWRINVLDKYLEDLRISGALAYEDIHSAIREDHSAPWLVELVHEYGLPEQWGAPANGKLQALIVQTRVGAVSEFMGWNYAVVMGATAAFKDIPDTQAKRDFQELLMNYTAAFQKRDFS